MDLYYLRQGLHVIASSWDYHEVAESWVSVRGNSVRFNAGDRYVNLPAVLLVFYSTS
jgi:hypothetical protein